MRNRQIIYGCVLCGVFAANIVFTEYLPFLLLCILVLLPVVMFVYTLILRNNLAITIKEKREMAIRGGVDEYCVQIENKTIVPVSAIKLQVAYQYDHYHVPSVFEHTVSVNSMEQKELRGKIRLEHTGMLTIHLSHSYLYDPLRLFCVPLKQKAEQKIMVMPVLEEPDYYSIYTTYDNLLESSEYSAQRPGEDASEIFDVREYQQGDSLNRIHWKLSAKEDTLVVKEFSMPLSRSNCILLELNETQTKEERCKLDGIYELGFAIGNLACLKEREFALAYYSSTISGLRIHWITNQEELEKAVQMLIQERTYQGSKTFRAYLESELFSVQNCFYITAQIAEEILEYMNVPSEQNLAVYCIDDGAGMGEVTRLEGGMLNFVDCNEIRQGLRNVLM